LIFNTLAYLSPPADANQEQTVPALWIAWSTALVLIALILFVSYLSFNFIENPARRWLNSKAATEIPNPLFS